MNKLGTFQNILLLWLSAGLVGCISSKDVTRQATERTDYVIGGTYALEKPVFLHKYDKADLRETPTLQKLGFSGTSTNLADFQQRDRNRIQVAGLMMPGDRVKIERLVEERSPTVGKILHVYAIVVAGESKDSIVDVTFVSKQDFHKSHIFRDSAYL